MSLPGRAYGLLAELTYRCPLHCPYCSNPRQVPGHEPELTQAEWLSVLSQARDLGCLHAHFSGGEPLQRPDLAALVAGARGMGLYCNLITSGLGLDEARLEALRQAGLDSVQISLQADSEGLGDHLAGTKAHAAKIQAARLVRRAGLPLTLNVVLHRFNLDRLEAILALALDLGAWRLELAHAQYYGWAMQNRLALLPSRAQVLEAAQICEQAAQRLAGRLQITTVLPDYHQSRPKPCMQGWGRRFITVNPYGRVLPCANAGEIPGMIFESVRSRDLAWIWAESEAFQRFRGQDWMQEPCRSCPEKEADFGGCRCQAALLTGDPAQSDPVCSLSPRRAQVDAVLKKAEEAGAAQPLVYRKMPENSL